MIALIATVLAVTAILVNESVAMCIGTNVFCSLISDDSICVDAGCALKLSLCSDPASGKVPCSNVTSENTCNEARCTWRETTTTTATSSPSAASTSGRPVTTTRVSTSAMASLSGLRDLTGMIAVIVITISTILFVLLPSSIVYLRHR